MSNAKLHSTESPLTMRSPAEELVNTITHGLGFVGSLVGAILLMVVVLVDGDVWRVAGCSIYAASLVCVYAMSTLSHSARTPKWKLRFRVLDQAFIYILIVATYTPFSLAFLRAPPWWTFLAVMWLLAIFGFLSKLLFAYRVEAVSVWLYVALGWMPIFSAPTLIHLLPGTALLWMLAGGLCYTLGTIFLLNDRKYAHFHAIWHAMVIAGSACHFVAIVQFVARGV